MPNYLITGYWGEPHVTAENDRGFNAAVFGPGRYVLPVGEQLRAEFIGNNTVRLYDGKLIDGGAVAGIPAGKYVDLLIPEAGQGMNRNDIIAFQYSKDAATLIETGDFVVIPGTETAGAAVDPALTQQDILTDEATFDQFALYRVTVSGANISAPAQFFEVAGNMEIFAERVNEEIGKLNAAADSFRAVNILDNSDWVNPVNQRGNTAYTGLGYSIDRWVVSAAAALTVADGFALIQNDATEGVAMFTQRLEPGTLVEGKTYTGVFCFSGGTISHGSAVCTSGVVNLTEDVNNIYMQIAPSTEYDAFRICVKPGVNARIKWVALYEGEYTAKNLPKYQPKGYSAEFIECSRYFINCGEAYSLAGYTSTSGTTAYFNFPTPVEMRAKPTLGHVGGNDYFAVRSDGTHKIVQFSACNMLNRNPNNIAISCPTELPAKSACTLYYDGADMFLSADL